MHCRLRHPLSNSLKTSQRKVSWQHKQYRYLLAGLGKEFPVGSETFAEEVCQTLAGCFRLLLLLVQLLLLLLFGTAASGGGVGRLDTRVPVGRRCLRVGPVQAEQNINKNLPGFSWLIF